jgi:hypothetical protein
LVHVRPTQHRNNLGRVAAAARTCGDAAVRLHANKRKVPIQLSGLGGIVIGNQHARAAFHGSFGTGHQLLMLGMSEYGGCIGHKACATT